ncbi:MAG: DUF2827 family protein [Saccharofermentanales bacterium]
MKNINIGLSVSIKEDNKSMWSNGILQNVFNLATVLNNSKNNYNVYAVNIANVDIKELPWGNDTFLKCYKFDEIKDDIDLMIMIGSQIYTNWADYIKKRGCKIISYHCGSNYIVDMEKSLFGNEENPNPSYFNYYDETWMIPQNENMNYYYYKVMERVDNVKIIPFVWSSYFIDKIIESGKLENNGRYKPSVDKRISILEPNINVVKFCMYPLLIAENLYRKSKDSFKHLYVTNSEKIKSNKYFIKLMKHLDIVKDKKATFEGRYITPVFLSKFTDIIISHQWENPLNYAYLDTLYLGYPLIHNAKMIKDAGYYYENSNVDMATNILEYVIKHHDKNIEEYELKTKKILDRYSVNNKLIIEEYDILIDNLFKKNINEEKYDLIKEKYEYYINQVSDIYEHLPSLKRYGSKCNTIVEIVNSHNTETTYSFLSSNPKKMTSVYYNSNFSDIDVIKKWTDKNNINYKHYDINKFDMCNTDLLFISNNHTYNDTLNNLNKYKNYVSKYIIIDQTEIYKNVDEIIFDNNQNEQNNTNTKKQGVYNAILDFTKKNKTWIIKESFKNNNGLIILKKKN